MFDDDTHCRVIQLNIKSTLIKAVNLFRSIFDDKRVNVGCKTLNKGTLC